MNATELNPEFVKWTPAEVGRGRGPDYKKIGSTLVPLPADNSPETFQSYVGWLGGPSVILNYLDGNGIRVKCQAKGRTLIEAGKSANDDGAKDAILTALRNPGTRGPAQTGNAALDAARQRAYDMAISLGLSEDDANKMANAVKQQN